MERKVEKAGIVAAAANARFREGRVSNDLSAAGLLLHQLDGLLLDSGRPSGQPWHSLDVFSAFLVNSRMPALPSGAIPLFNEVGAGILLAPGDAQIHCSYHGDGLSGLRTCPPSFHTGCISGCPDVHGSGWCGVKNLSGRTLREASRLPCAWKPDMLKQMLQAHRRGEVLLHGSSFRYNEVCARRPRGRASSPFDRRHSLSHPGLICVCCKPDSACNLGNSSIVPTPSLPNPMLQVVVDGIHWGANLPTSVEAFFIMRAPRTTNGARRSSAVSDCHGGRCLLADGRRRQRQSVMEQRRMSRDSDQARQLAERFARSASTSVISQSLPSFAASRWIRTQLVRRQLPRACSVLPQERRARSKACQLASARAKGLAIHASFLRWFGLSDDALPLLELNASDWFSPFSVYQPT